MVPSRRQIIPELRTERREQVSDGTSAESLISGIGFDPLLPTALSDNGFVYSDISCSGPYRSRRFEWRIG